MKKITIICIITTVLSSSLIAQDTNLQSSTASAPIWYNINSAATAAGATNAGLAAVTDAILGDIVRGTKPVSGQFVATVQNQDKYLWRFEDGGNGSVKWINKATGKELTNPATTGTVQNRFVMSISGSTFVPATVAGISTAGVSGTAFYFTPTDPTYAAAGRINCDGGSAELVFFKSATNGDILQTGGKGSLFWLRLVSMKSVKVSSSDSNLGSVFIMKDDSITAETGSEVSKAQTAGVVVKAEPVTGARFVEWQNKSTGNVVSTDSRFVYSAINDVELVAVFNSVSTGINEYSQTFTHQNPFSESITLTNVPEGTHIRLLDETGKTLLTTSAKQIDTSGLKSGIYFLQIQINNEIFNQKLLKR